MNINYSDVDWTKPGAKKQRVDNGTFASWIVCVMDSIVVRNLIMDDWFDKVLLNVKKFEDASSANNPFLVKITSNNEKITHLVCDEMLYAILLSEPTLIKIDKTKHKNYQLVDVGWSYIDGDFIIPGEIE
jgi:hypothetical protein